MKIKLFEAFNDSKEIDSICKKYGITNYTINSDGTVDVDDDVNLRNRGLNKLPLKFGKVTGDFSCSYNQLVSLEGSPTSVGGDFNCNNNNQLVTLEGAPTSVGGDFYCHSNKLVSLKGGPHTVIGYFNCSYNQLVTLKGSPHTVGEFFCDNNKLKTLQGSPTSVGGDFYCKDNPIHKWFNQINKSNIELFLDFNVHSDDPDEINQEKINMINED